MSEDSVVIAYKLPQELRSKLKEPWGFLIRGSPTETMTEVKRIVNKENPPEVISVGDIVSLNLHEHQVVPRITIVDNKCMRKETKKRIFQAENLVRVRNPHGTITEEARAAVQKAVRSNRNLQIIVEGEEDLLTLIAVLYAPNGSLVVYGQPNEGVVAIRVNDEKKAEAKAFLKAMETCQKLNKKATYEVNTPNK